MRPLGLAGLGSASRISSASASLRNLAATAVRPEHAARGAKRGPIFAGDTRAFLFAALRLADVMTAGLAAVLCYWLRFRSLALPAHYWWPVIFACIVTAQSMRAAQLYEPSRLADRTRQLGAVVASWTGAWLCVVALVYGVRPADGFAPSWICLWWGAALAGLIAVRAAWWGCLARFGSDLLATKIAVVGTGPAADRLARAIAERRTAHARIVGTFADDCASDRAPTGTGRTLDELLALTRHMAIDEIAIALSWTETPGLDRILHVLGGVPADIKLYLDVSGVMPSGPAAPLPSVVLSRRPLAGWRTLFKRSIDLSVGLALLGAFTPLMLAVAVAVKLDSPGPALFRQQRLGFNKRVISVYKFRTMIWETNPDPAVPQARRDDPRVTRIGRFLRRTSLDELPQLLNVLAGTMSLIGPRPHAISHDEKYAALIDGYFARHRVKPGITGWAQINGFRGETDTIDKMKGRLACDLFYIENWSPTLDLTILWRTLLVGFIDPRAY